MKSVSILVLVGVFTFVNTNAQIRNSKTIQTNIYGNCKMCKTRIEEAGNINNTVRVEWNPDNKIANITYDSVKTNLPEIERRIALAGHDSDDFLAPDQVYDALPSCCRYDRINKVKSINQSLSKSSVINTATPDQQTVSPLESIFNQYIAIKEALVKSDAGLSAQSAANLYLEIKRIKTENLSSSEFNKFSNFSNSILDQAKNISSNNALAIQRKYFEILTKDFYGLLKATKSSTPVYLQHCPMFNDGKGADWLSKEAKVLNPYYGPEMLTCGKIIETIN